MTNFRFVMTGAPGSGKTTVLKALAERGYDHASDSARFIIRRRVRSGLSPRPPLDQFGREMLALDIARYRGTPVTRDPVFFDRGIVDALCFLDQQGAVSMTEVKRHIKAFPYNEVVFIMPPWEDIYHTDAERDQRFSESIQVYESLSSWYARWEYQPVEVPHAGIEERADFVLQTVGASL